MVYGLSNHAVSDNIHCTLRSLTCRKPFECILVCDCFFCTQQEDKAKVHNVKVISSEECVPKHKLLVMDMWFKATKTWHRKFEPRVRVWKLKEEKTCEEYRSMVGDNGKACV